MFGWRMLCCFCGRTGGVTARMENADGCVPAYANISKRRIAKKMKDVPADTPFIFFHWLICVSPLRDFVGGHGMLICSAGHDRPSRACSAPSSMPNDLKYKAIVAERCRGVQVENASSPREPAYPFIIKGIIITAIECETPIFQTRSPH